MIILLAALMAKPAEREHIIYYCKSSGSPVEFSLVYDRRGTKISDVLIVVRDSPRLPPDNITKWRGKPNGQGVSFSFRHIENSFWTSGEMELTPNGERPGHSRLTWSSTMGGIGGHVPMGSPEQTADCVPEGAADQRS
jgi:hypothetical protein